MMDAHDLERTGMIFLHAQAGSASAAEKRELREILARYSERAWDLGWKDLLDVARALESESSIFGASAHLLGIGRKP